jgi:hypothetical protein
MPAPDGSAGSHRGLLLSGAAYSVLFVLLAWPWLRLATHAAPVGHLMAPADERLVPWILAWVAHALATDPAHLMDANINHPAPKQLAGLEHFLSTQVVFAPVHAVADNAVLGASVAVLLSYPLAALAMERLLLALGCLRGAAWVGGLVFALGPLRVPASLMLVKFANLYLPLIALALTRLRERPTLPATAALTTALVMALLSSYYLALLAAVAAALWAVFELVRPSAHRGRFALLAVAATAVAGSLLVLVSLPYFARPEAARMPKMDARRAFGNFLAARAAVQSSGRFPLVLAACGVIAFLSPAPAARRTAARGLALVIAAQLLMRGPVEWVCGRQVPMPFALIEASPARFFRAPNRFAVMLGFGTALLAAAGLDAAGRRLGRAWGGFAIGAAGIALLVTRGAALSGSGFDEFRGQSDPIYAHVRAAVGADRGPLLELPVISPMAALRNPQRPGVGTDIEAMLGSTRHWLPLLTGVSPPNQPPHRELVDAAIARLPASDALDDLVSMTRVRWILLRPRGEWPAATGAVRDGLFGLPGVTSVSSLEGWELLRVERRARHPGWFAAIAAGQRPGHTVLGTPLAPLAEEAARSRVGGGLLPPRLAGGRRLHLPLQVTDLGTADWPVSVPPGAPPTYTVRLEARWRRAGTPDDAESIAARETFELLRDVPAGDTLRQEVWLTPPTEPGPYRLEIAIFQLDGARFIAPGNEPLRVQTTVVPAPAG